MSIEGIIQRIQKDAAAEAERIRQEYFTQVNELEKKCDAERKHLLDTAQKQADIECQKSRRRTIDRGKSLLSQKALSIKMDLLNKLYQSVREKIENLNPDEYGRLFAGILAQIGESEGTVVVAMDKSTLDRKFIHQAVQILENNNKKAEFALKTIDSNWRGFYLECGKIRYDGTLDAIMQILREKSEEKVIAKLFG